MTRFGAIDMVTLCGVTGISDQPKKQEGPARCGAFFVVIVAEEEGFEPSIRGIPA